MTSPLVRRSAYKQQEVLMIIKDDKSEFISPKVFCVTLHVLHSSGWVDILFSIKQFCQDHQLIVKIIILMKHRQVYCESVVVKQKRSLDFNGGGCWNSHRQVKRRIILSSVGFLLIFYFYFLQRQRRMI